MAYKSYKSGAHLADQISNAASEGNFRSASTGISAADEIKKLKDLLDAGVLTPEEFQQKKTQILG